MRNMTDFKAVVKFVARGLHIEATEPVPIPVLGVREGAFLFHISKDGGTKFLFAAKMREMGYNTSSRDDDDKTVVVFND